MSALSGEKIPLWQRILALAERRLPALTRLRAVEDLPIRLHRRRIYVVPTGFGFAFAILLGVMLLGALNYSNNPAVLLTCTLGAAGWVSLFAAFRAISGLELVSIHAMDCHAGDPVQLRCLFDPGMRDRPSMRLRWANTLHYFALPAGEEQAVLVNLPTTQRGWLRPGRLKLWTEQPFGLFILWSWLNPPLELLIYPAIEQDAPPLPLGQGKDGSRAVAGEGQEYANLREYRTGDPPRQIAWKASARHDSLFVREHERPIGATLVLDYGLLYASEPEARIRRLTAWVLAAEAAQLSYALHLPGQQFPAGLGSSHRHACLRALAVMPHAAQ